MHIWLISLCLLLALPASAQNLTASQVRILPAAPPACPGGRVCVFGNSATSPNRVAFVDASGGVAGAGDAWRARLFAGLPPGFVSGDIWYNTADKRFYFVQDGISSPVLTSGTPVLAGTITGIYALGGTPSLAVNLNAASHKIINLATATASGDAASKGYVDGAITAATGGERAFTRSCTLTSAAAVTPISCLLDADVGGSKNAYAVAWHAFVNGATAWTGVLTCVLRDTAGTAFATLPVAALTANTFLNDNSAGVTLSAPYALGSGTALGKGLEVACDSNGLTGSDLVLTVGGTVR